MAQITAMTSVTSSVASPIFRYGTMVNSASAVTTAIAAAMMYCIRRAILG